MQNSIDSFKTLKKIEVNKKSYNIFSLAELAKDFPKVKELPFGLRILLENLLRCEDGKFVNKGSIEALINTKKQTEIAYRPSRVLLQDFTGVPVVVDLAAMRNAMLELGGDAAAINPLSKVDLVIDHSVMVDYFASSGSLEKNVELEFSRNFERYEFLKWGKVAFDNFRVVPPGTGICHQVNLEYLASVITADSDYAYFDTLVGADSHTTMVNGLGVLGWGVGGIEAEAAMLGQPISMLIPSVVGVNFVGKLKEGITATDLVLTVTEKLRSHGVVEKFVEYYGEGLKHLSLADRATIANMSPEYGATCGLFPIDDETIKYLKISGRDDDQIALIVEYAKSQSIWHGEANQTFDGEKINYNEKLEINLDYIKPSIAGPKRPQDRIDLDKAATNFNNLSDNATAKLNEVPVDSKNFKLKNGSIVIAAITSCTNTSNPEVLIAAGLLAKKAYEFGLKSKAWVKTSFAPGSQVVTEYLVRSGLAGYLDKLGFDLVGYGCTTCIGNSGPLDVNISRSIEEGNLNVCSVLSGNRNFEGRISPDVKSSYLASPPLVVAYSILGDMSLDLYKTPLGVTKDGKDIFFSDLWPKYSEIRRIADEFVTSKLFLAKYAEVFEGPKEWQEIKVDNKPVYNWPDSTYIKQPPYFDKLTTEPSLPKDIVKARALLILGDSITTDHISPAGAFKPSSEAGEYLKSLGVLPKDFNSYGARRGNHEVMMRGTFANPRLKNELASDEIGGFTKHFPDGEIMSTYKAALKYQQTKEPLVVIAGKNYGNGSSRDWAAKGTKLLGIKAVIVESFERIHRSNLVGMGVLPLQFIEGTNRNSLKLSGFEQFDLLGIKDIKPSSKLELVISRDGKIVNRVQVLVRIDTEGELEYYQHGGVLNYVLRDLLNSSK